MLWDKVIEFLLKGIIKIVEFVKKMLGFIFFFILD